MTTRPVPSPAYPVPVFLIDVHARTVTEVPHDGTLGQLYRLISCDYVDFTARQPDGDGLFCNDLLPDVPVQAAFRFRATGQLIYGNAVWVGGDAAGNTVSPRRSLIDLTADIDFLGLVPYSPAMTFVVSWW
jgi:hypothetical protein